MTETQTPRPNHRAPLAPGEIRTHTVGAVTFQVMHVAGGSFTQARVVGGNVLATERFERDAVRAYADAIEQAESDAIDALDDADGVAFISSATGELVEPDAETAEERAARHALDRPLIEAFDDLRREHARHHAPGLADDVAALRQGITDAYTPLSAMGLLAALDRIAAQVPVRATDRRGDLLRMHMPCRQIVTESRSACRSCDEVGEWRALYTLGGAA